MSKRNPDVANRWMRQLIYVRDKGRCRWCQKSVQQDAMIVAHGIAHADAPSLDQFHNWFTCCEDCNKVGRWSAPPQPIPIEEASVPQLQETNEQLRGLAGLVKELVAHSKPTQAEPKPVFKLDICQAKGARCAMVGCQIPSCGNYTHFAYNESTGGVGVVHEYDPHKSQW
jgi:hypothetical protein